ncbi:hypothetical protein ABENE_17810 [Asticcacaulis benevestitus DSM 16100 = ATCC BAA-896]|uniref:Uncharacterized protein n=1 Tax=Asticcacaulis benevestitus DSM 16100 = ATCC BAA-896 TaxID=1121022 RepID=V4PFA4_9CAUL|nr:hypothetical protein [Asticcacaulis benevestitus]ESQ86811.1 hypothetical protein ABENE_17810 [Asticcacaulis benevestitus DSM 16100 = ATCC BAA-896]
MRKRPRFQAIAASVQFPTIKLLVNDRYGNVGVNMTVKKNNQAFPRAAGTNVVHIFYELDA